MTPEQKKKYLSDPNDCPYCGSSIIEAGYMDVDGTQCYCVVTCGECEKQWRDVFKMVDVEEI